MLWLSIYSSSTASTARHGTAQRNHTPARSGKPSAVRADQSTYQELYVRTCVRRPGCPSWSLGLLAFSSRLFAPKRLDHLPHLSLRSILPCERA